MTTALSDFRFDKPILAVFRKHGIEAESGQCLESGNRNIFGDLPDLETGERIKKAISAISPQVRVLLSTECE